MPGFAVDVASLGRGLLQCERECRRTDWFCIANGKASMVLPLQHTPQRVDRTKPLAETGEHYSALNPGSGRTRGVSLQPPLDPTSRDIERKYPAKHGTLLA
jgi:hypothetical protein